MPRVRVIRDPDYGEKPRPYFKIRCFSCRMDLAGKANLRRDHLGHQVHYVNVDGKIDE